MVLPTTAPDVEHVFHLYVVRTPLRDALHGYLAGARVGTSIHDQKGAQQQKAYAPLGGEGGSCTHAEAAAGEVLSLPLFPQLSLHEVEQVTRLIWIFFAMH